MTRARNLSKLSNPAVFTVDTDNNLGINSTSPVEKVNVVGVVSATSFFGDGTGLTGVASTDNIITGTAATFNSVVKVGTGITLDATSGIVTATGVNVTGVVTATTFLGNVTGNVTGNATGLSGSPSINVTNITASGTVTYEDVTNVDSVGVVTARGGFEIGASGVGGTITAVGNAEFAGIVTATSYRGDGSSLTGVGGDTDITSSLFI